MGVRLTEEECWERLEAGHTGVLTTLRRDGWPVSLPMWYWVHERIIYARARRDSATAGRVHNDPRACFLVESGRAWTELSAVVVYARATVLAETEEAARARAEIDRKYAAFRPPAERMPAAARRHYADRVILRLDPVGTMISWDNARMRLRG